MALAEITASWSSAECMVAQPACAGGTSYAFGRVPGKEQLIKVLFTHFQKRRKQQSASWWVLVVMVTVNGRPWSTQHCSSEELLPTCRDIYKDSLELQGSKEQCPISRASGSVSEALP